jgi:hypothetical protein
LAVRGDKPGLLWATDLKAPAVGEPAIADGMVYQAAGRSVHRISLAGSTETPWPLPSPAASAAAARGDLVAVGCADGSLHVWRAGQPAWTTACGSPVQAVTLLKDRLVVGLQDGTILAFAP